MHSSIYPPREDSYLLQKNIKKYAKGKVLEIGTGSGILAITAAKKARTVLAVDINPEAIKHCTTTHKIKNIKFKESNIFSNIKWRFDTIIFNPPYLPNDNKIKDIALDGGKKGYELTERFLIQAANYLNEKGVILLLFSSLTNKDKIDTILDRALLKFQNHP